jgi:Ca-activated chloride channel family protein
MLEFAHPWVLLLTPLPLLVWWLAPPQRERVSAMRVPFFEQIAAAAGSEARVGAVVMRRRWLQMAVAILVWLLLVTAIAKPEWVGEHRGGTRHHAGPRFVGVHGLCRLPR